MAQSRATATARCPGETEPRAPSPWLSADKQTLKTPFANNAQNRTEQNRTGQTGSEDVRRGRGRAGGRHGLWVTEVTPRRRPSASSHLRPGPGGRRPLRAAEPADVTGAEGQACPEPGPPPPPRSLLAHHRPPRVSVECARVTAAVASASPGNPSDRGPSGVRSGTRRLPGPHGQCADASSAQRLLWASVLPTPLRAGALETYPPPAPEVGGRAQPVGGGPSQGDVSSQVRSRGVTWNPELGTATWKGVGPGPRAFSHQLR